MNTPITTYIFDCFGVVCDPVLGGWYKDYVKKYGFEDENLHNIFRQFDLGKLSENAVLEYFMKYKGIKQSKEDLRKDIDSHLKLDEVLAGIIRKLKQKGFKTVLLSNANNDFFERKVYTTFPDFKNMFDEVIISSLIGMVKPDDDIYKYTLEKIDSKPGESLFVDDNKINVDAAVRLGMQGVVYTDRKAFVDYLDKSGINLNE